MAPGTMGTAEEKNNGAVTSQQYRALWCAAVLAAFIPLCFCCGIFFPPTGIPYKVTPLRSTPMGVITQLIDSYEQQRIDRFEDLFPVSETFQFYVSPQFTSVYLTEPYQVNPPETADPRLHFIGSYPSYYYWTQAIEIQHHKRLFEKAVSIQFTVKPYVDSSNFHYIVNNGETTNVEILMTDGIIDFIFDNGDGSYDDYSVWIEKQVFLLERDADNLWVIRKWYDFGNHPS